MDAKELWYVKRVSAEEYEKLVPVKRVFFNEPKFNELNSDKVDEVFYLILMRGDSARFGVIIGKDGDFGKCPFSAPYSYPVSIFCESKIESIDAGLSVLEAYCYEQGIRKLRFIFPPLFYDEHLLSGWINAFYRNSYQVQNLDVNYAINLQEYNVDEEKYGQMITEKGRKGFKKGLKQHLNIIKCETEDDYREAYRIIQLGHSSKGFPVKMSFEQLWDTISLVGHDAFIVQKDAVSIVAEYLYRVNDKVVQGIYTGTHPDYMNSNGMNVLTYHTIKYYADLGYQYLDKAISTEDSVPNYGLCNFKESVGCKRSLKYTFYKELQGDI